MTLNVSTGTCDRNYDFNLVSVETKDRPIETPADKHPDKHKMSCLDYTQSLVSQIKNQ
jgi:hypothetical protein